MFRLFALLLLPAATLANLKPFFPFDLTRVSVPENSLNVFVANIPAAVDQEGDAVTYWKNNAKFFTSKVQLRCYKMYFIA